MATEDRIKLRKFQTNEQKKRGLYTGSGAALITTRKKEFAIILIKEKSVGSSVGFSIGS